MCGLPYVGSFNISVFPGLSCWVWGHCLLVVMNPITIGTTKLPQRSDQFPIFRSLSSLEGLLSPTRSPTCPQERVVCSLKGASLSP